MNSEKKKCAICLVPTIISDLQYFFKKKVSIDFMKKRLKNPKSLKMIHNKCAKYYQFLEEVQYDEKLKVFVNGFFIQALYLENCVFCHKGPVLGKCLLKCRKEKCRLYFHNNCVEKQLDKYKKEEIKGKILFYCEKHKPKSQKIQLMEIEKQQKVDEIETCELDEIFEEIQDIQKAKLKYLRVNHTHYMKTNNLNSKGKQDIDEYDALLNKHILGISEGISNINNLTLNNLNNIGKRSKDQRQNRNRIKKKSGKVMSLKMIRITKGRNPYTRSRRISKLNRHQKRDRNIIITVEQFVKDIGMYSQDPDAFWDFIDYKFFTQLKEKSNQLLEKPLELVDNQFQNNKSQVKLNNQRVIYAYSETIPDCYKILISKGSKQFLSQFYYPTTAIHEQYKFRPNKSIQILNGKLSKSLSSYIKNTKLSHNQHPETLQQHHADFYKQIMQKFNKENLNLISKQNSLKLMNYKKIKQKRFIEMLKQQQFLNEMQQENNDKTKNIDAKGLSQIDLELQYLKSQKSKLEQKISEKFEKLKMDYLDNQDDKLVLSEAINQILKQPSDICVEKYRNLRIKQLIISGCIDKLRINIKVLPEENIVEKSQFTPKEELDKIREEEKKDMKKNNFFYTDCQICFSGVSSDINPICYCSACNASFHQYCYGLKEVPGEDDFYCKPCRSKNKEEIKHIKKNPWQVTSHLKPCVLCGQIFLPKVFVSRNHAHIYCIYLWGLGEFKNHKMSIKNQGIFGLAKKQKINKKCKFCKLNTGLLKQCSYSIKANKQTCKVYFHPLCAFLYGSYFEIKQSSSEQILKEDSIIIGTKEIKIYCPNHQSNNRDQIQQIYARRYGINYLNASQHRTQEGFYEKQIDERLQYLMENNYFQQQIIKKLEPFKYEDEDIAIKNLQDCSEEFSKLSHPYLDKDALVSHTTQAQKMDQFLQKLKLAQMQKKINIKK